jgi:hypothetical protein
VINYITWILPTTTKIIYMKFSKHVLLKNVTLIYVTTYRNISKTPPHTCLPIHSLLFLLNLYFKKRETTGWVSPLWSSKLIKNSLAVYQLEYQKECLEPNIFSITFLRLPKWSPDSICTYLCVNYTILTSHLNHQIRQSFTLIQSPALLRKSMLWFFRVIFYLNLNLKKSHFSPS